MPEPNTVERLPLPELLRLAAGMIEVTTYHNELLRRAACIERGHVEIQRTINALTGCKEPGGAPPRGELD